MFAGTELAKYLARSSKPSASWACGSLALHVRMVLNGVRNHVVTVGAPVCRQSIRLRVAGISTPRPEAKSQGECLTHCYLDWDCSPSFLPKNRDLEPTEITEFKLSFHVFLWNFLRFSEYPLIYEFRNVPKKSLRSLLHRAN